ncbi:MAG: M48 family metallopeptidase [Planctomycetota bacterium]
MTKEQEDFSKAGFVQSVVLPALLLFLIPTAGLLFFRHARSSFDDDARRVMLKQVTDDQEMTDEDRAQSREVIDSVPFSAMLRNPEFAQTVDAGLRRDYATFRWMIWLSWWSILSGVGVLLLAGVCVAFSLRSQQAQYLSLSVGWHVLRIYGAIQTVVQGAIVVALSFWMTALWAEVYYVKLIAIAGVAALAGIIAVLVAIFKQPENDYSIEGEVISRDDAPALWQNLASICQQVGTELPDQVIAGIDANFFVTTQPVTVGQQEYTGRTLYASLALMKMMAGTEADAVMAHEMAHFSGDDTTYSKKISPLLIRYNNYLQGLHDGVVTLPIFYFMLCFRNLFELSLNKLSREREFRADRIAADVTSPDDIASALLRIAAYATYRNSIEDELFKQEESLGVANISEQIESGFAAYSASFLSNHDLRSLETFHPFDTHPPTAQRLAAVGVDSSAANGQRLLANEVDGRWYRNIHTADQLEGEQWSEYEERFRKFHEEVLTYRYLPENQEQMELVVKYFPARAFTGKKNELDFDYEKVKLSSWAEPILWSRIKDCSMNDGGVLEISSKNAKTKKIKTREFGAQAQEVVEVFNQYYTRYLAAREYKKKKEAEIATAFESEATSLD